MTQALYAHMNNKKIKIKKNPSKVPSSRCIDVEHMCTSVKHLVISCLSLPGAEITGLCHAQLLN
jgi:hypothetical protein